MIIDQVKSDIVFIEKEMESLKKIRDQKPNPNKINPNKFNAEYSILERINNYQSEWIRLKAIIVRNKEPLSYISMVTGKVYTRITEAKSQKIPIPKIRTPEIKTKKIQTPESKTTQINPSEHYSSKNKPVFRYYSHSRKESRKTTGRERSRFFLHSDDGKPDIVFDMEHRADKKYPHGEFSQKVKKGFKGNETKPAYAVKIFKKGIFDKSSSEEMRIAMRAAYCARLLGRTGQTFRRNNKEYFITDFHHGRTMSILTPKEFAKLPIAERAAFLTPEEIMKMPIENRIAIAMDLTRQIAILHAHGFIHSDIKPGNVILSDTASFLIDLDSILLKSDIHNVAVTVTPIFLDSKLNREFRFGSLRKDLDEKSDLYALGLTLSYLFPEVVSHTDVTKTAFKNEDSTGIYEYSQKIVHKGPKYQEHQELADILLSLSANLKSFRPESAKEVYQKLGQINQSKYGKSFATLDTFATDISRQTGEQAYKEIETEIVEQNESLVV